MHVGGNQPLRIKCSWLGWFINAIPDLQTELQEAYLRMVPLIWLFFFGWYCYNKDNNLDAFSIYALATINFFSPPPFGALHLPSLVFTPSPLSLLFTRITLIHQKCIVHSIIHAKHDSNKIHPTIIESNCDIPTPK